MINRLLIRFNIVYYRLGNIKIPQQIGYLFCGRENHAEVRKKLTANVALTHGILASMSVLVTSFLL